MAFTVSQLIDALEAAPQDALVMVEYGVNIKAFTSLQVIEVPGQRTMLSIRAEDAEAVDPEDVH